MKRAVSIIMPAFNEEGNVAAAIRGVQDAAKMAGIVLSDYEIIVVDDGSTDRTIDAVFAHRRTSTAGIAVAAHGTNLGLRAAYEMGLSLASMPYVTWVPGDGEMATTSIAAILSAVGTADLVIPFHGTPHKRAWFRRLLTWGSTLQLNVLLGRRLNYYQGTVVYPTALARRLPRTEPGFFCMAEMLAWALEEGLSYVEVPLEHIERTSGVSKAVGWGKIWAAQRLIARLAFRIHAERMARDAEGLFAS